jgi:hypothetical protein
MVRWRFIYLLAIVLPLCCENVGIKRRLEHTKTVEPVSFNASSSSASSSAAPRPRGGIKQRLLESTNEDTPRNTEPLVDDLTHDWAKGDINSRQFQRYSKSSKGQGAEGPLLDKTSATGTCGKHPQNIMRGLINALGMPTAAPAIDWVQIPTTKGPLTPHPVVFPHLLFKGLHDHRPELFTRVIAGAAGAALEFWQDMRQTEFVRKHPELPEAVWGHTTPLVMHSDGAPISKHDSLYVISWSSLLAASDSSTLENKNGVYSDKEIRADS